MFGSSGLVLGRIRRQKYTDFFVIDLFVSVVFWLLLRGVSVHRYITAALTILLRLCISIACAIRIACRRPRGIQCCRLGLSKSSGLGLLFVICCYRLISLNLVHYF